ncbi:MAG: protein-S-isoprenylcysteine O-methyltransferase [Planctomycetota bacterium]
MLRQPSDIVFLVGFAVGAGVRVAYVVRARRGPAPPEREAGRDTPLDRALVLAAGLCLAVVPFVYLFSPWLDFADYRGPGWMTWVGGPVFAAAVGFLWRAHADLGRHWSPTLRLRADHALVTRGVYAHIRHPMYAAHWLWGVAQALLLQNWIAGPCLLVAFLPLYLVRVRREEAALADRFGAAWRAYARQTGRLVPRLRPPRRAG